MLPITRATVDNFCRVCLQVVDKCETAKDMHHDLKDNPQILRIVQSMADGMPPMGTSFNLAMPNYLCHSCYIKVDVFTKFAQMSICTSVALRELTAEHELANDPKFQMICGTCFKIKSDNDASQNLISATELQDLLRIIYMGIDKRKLNEKELEPKCICKYCFHKCRTFIEFQKLTQESSQYFMSILANGNDLAEPSSSIIMTESTQFFDEYELLEEENVNKSCSPTDQNSLGHDSEPEMEDAMLSTSDDNDDNDDKDDPFELCDIHSEGSTSNHDNEISLETTKESDIIISRHCEKCNRTFRRFSAFKSHKCTPGEETETKTKDKSLRTKKVAKKSVTERFNCEICHKNFKSEAWLKLHIDRIHCKPMHKCTHCEREFKRKSHLMDHITAVHEGLRPFKCEFCERTFGLRSTLRVHQMGHTDERPFECNLCDKKFRQITQLNIHIRNHLGNPQFKCPICSHSKCSQEELDEHLSRHNNRDGYQCSKCGRKFKKQCHLRDHDNAVHLKLRPFKCTHEDCEKSFAALKTLKQHQLTHLDEGRPSDCAICGKTFSSRANLLRHVHMHKELVVKEKDDD